MKANSRQLLTIEELVDSVCFDLGYGMQRKELLLQFGVRLYKRYRKNHAKEYRKVLLSMTPWKAITLPADCVDPILLGIPNGESFDILVNKKLNPRYCGCDDDAPTAAVYTPENGSEGIQLNSLTQFGEDAGKQYGLASKDIGLGYFEINHVEDSNEIQLSANINSSTQILLIYLPTLFDPDRDSCIHPYAQDMIESGIHYEDLKMRQRRGDRSVNGGMVEEAKREHDERICELAEAASELTSDMVIELSRDSFRLTPKN